MIDAQHLGEKVLAAFAVGRQKAIDQAREASKFNERLVREELDNDVLRGLPARGRPGRISRRLRDRIKITSRGVAKILERLVSRSRLNDYDESSKLLGNIK
jgi:hypothetical protein